MFELMNFTYLQFYILIKSLFLKNLLLKPATASSTANIDIGCAFMDL